MTADSEKSFIRRLGEQVVSAIVIMAVVLAVIRLFWMWSPFGEIEDSAFAKFGPDSGLKVTGHHDRQANGRLDVLGTFENTGKTTWTRVTIEVELFDANGVFVDECSHYDTGSFPPGAKEHFMVSCGGCKDHPLPEFKSYTVRIKDASTL